MDNSQSDTYYVLFLFIIERKLDVIVNLLVSTYLNVDILMLKEVLVLETFLFHLTQMENALSHYKHKWCAHCNSKSFSWNTFIQSNQKHSIHFFLCSRHTSEHIQPAQFFVIFELVKVKRVSQNYRMWSFQIYE